MPDLTVDNSSGTQTDNPIGTQSVSIGTDNASGQVGDIRLQEGTPTQDGDIFKGVDPNKLPPEAKAAYDSMLKDYREKTGRLSETVKSEVARATEAFRQKSEFYDQIASQEEFVKKWNDYVQQVQAQQGGQGNEDQALTKLEAKLQEITQEIELDKLSKITDAFSEAVNEKGEKIHPDFDHLNDIVIGQVPGAEGAEEYTFLRGFVELAQGRNPQEKLANGYKRAKEVYASIYEEGRKAGMGRLQSKVLNGTQAPTNVSGNGLSSTDKKPKNAKEALEMAKRGLVVSRE